MALTEAEKKFVLEILDKQKRSVLKSILSSVQSFLNWLADQVYDIYRKIKDYFEREIAYRIYEFFRGVFDL